MQKQQLRLSEHSSMSAFNYSNISIKTTHQHRLYLNMTAMNKNNAPPGRIDNLNI